MKPRPGRLTLVEHDSGVVSGTDDPTALDPRHADVFIERAANATQALSRFAAAIMALWPDITHLVVARRDTNRAVTFQPLKPWAAACHLTVAHGSPWQTVLDFGEPLIYHADTLPAYREAWPTAAAPLDTLRQVRSVEMLPLVARGHVVGSVALGHDHERDTGASRPQLTRLLRALARRLAREASGQPSAEITQKRRQVLANLLHDMRTPLAGIGVAAELLELDPSAVPHSIVEAIRTHSADLLRYMSELEDFRFTDLDPRLPPAIAIDLADVLEAVLWRTKPYTQRRRQKLRVFRRLDRPVLISPHHLEQALAAAVFDVSACSMEGKAVQIRIGEEQARAVITVEGIADRVPADLNALLLDPYLRARVGLSDAALISLAAGQRAIDHYGGTMSISTPNGRIVIAIGLPLA